MNEISRRETVGLEVNKLIIGEELLSSAGEVRTPLSPFSQDLDVQTEYNDALLSVIMVRAES